MNTRRMTWWLATIGALMALVMAGSMATARHDHHGDGTPAGHHHHDQGQMVATPGHDHHDHDHMMGSTGTGVIYLSITNDGDEDDVLLSATTDRADVVEIHEMRVSDNVAVMVPHDGPLEIPAGETVVLEPGGLHLMLLNLTEDNNAGDVFEVTLEFESAGEVVLSVPVRLDAEPMDDEPESETVESGDLTLEGVWSRPAPYLGSGPDAATPNATPDS